MTDPWLEPYPNSTLNFTAVMGTSTEKISIPQKELGSKQSVRTALLSRGIAIHSKETTKVEEFFMSWIQHLQKNKQFIVKPAPFGWVPLPNGDIEGFVFGGEKFTPAGTSSPSTADPMLQGQYKPTGKPNHWIKAAQLVTSQGRPALDAVIASAFAGPLVRFTGEPGCILSVYSQESGIGKTTALKIAQSVWGDPIKAMQGLTDTPLSVVRKLGQLSNLPVYWDELKSEEQHRKFVSLVFELTGRKEKTRLTQTATFRSSGSWQTMLISASNAPIADEVQAQTKDTQAGMYRVFEYEIAPSNGQGQIDQADASIIVSKLDHNYGQIGLDYSQWLGTYHKKVQEEVEEYYKNIGGEMNFATEERYWRVMVTTLMMGAKYANQLGFTQIDEPALKTFLAGAVVSLRTSQSSTTVNTKSAVNVENILAQYLNQMRADNTILTNIIYRGKGAPKKNTVKVLTDLTRLKRIFVHMAVDDKILRLARTNFHEWLDKHGHSPSMFQRNLADKFGAKEERGSLGAGTGRSNAQEYLIEIDISNTTLMALLDGVQ
jgi:hypothetical protein